MGNCLDIKRDTSFGLGRSKRINMSLSSSGSPKLSLSEFTKKGTIGQGSSSTVYLVEKTDSGKNFAMKVMKKSRKYKKDAKDIKHERVILERLRHPFLVNLHYAFQTGFTLHLVVELANGGDLYNHISRMKRLQEDHCRFYAAEILCGLEFLHRNGVIYRGLKPEDVLLDRDGHIKLSDFGLARSSEDITSTFCGEPYYMAPEIIKGDPQTFAVDWWSFGILIYEMLNGETPFRGYSPKDILKAILNQNITWPEHFSQDAKNLICKLLNPNPSLRLGCGRFGVNQIKQHKFFKGLNWEDVEDRQYTPPFIPNVQSESEVMDVDRELPQGPGLSTFCDKYQSQSRLMATEDNISNFYFNADMESKEL